MLLLKRCKHKNIIEYRNHFAVGNIAQSFYLVMQLAKYGDLGDRIKKQKPKNSGTWSKKVIKYVFGGILRGVQYLHDVMHVMHRDLKPVNVLICEGQAGCPVPKIADIGLALETDSTNQSVSKYGGGTPGYIAPEVAKAKDKQAKYTSRCDVWALGCILYDIW